jgi:hypothetical protein
VLGRTPVEGFTPRRIEIVRAPRLCTRLLAIPFCARTPTFFSQSSLSLSLSPSLLFYVVLSRGELQLLAETASEVVPNRLGRHVDNLRASCYSALSLSRPLSSAAALLPSFLYVYALLAGAHFISIFTSGRKQLELLEQSNEECVVSNVILYRRSFLTS